LDNIAVSLNYLKQHSATTVKHNNWRFFPYVVQHWIQLCPDPYAIAAWSTLE